MDLFFRLLFSFKKKKKKVSVDPSKYDVLRFWVLGHDVPAFQLSLSERVLNRLLRRAPRRPVEYFKRVVVALRLKADSKLILKAFKEVWDPFYNSRQHVSLFNKFLFIVV